MEATGHYWLTLFENLSKQYPVTVLNPMQIHAYRRSGVRKGNTDRADAFWIADFVRIGNRPPTNQSTPPLLQLRELTRFRSRLTEPIGDCKRRVLSVLYRVFPEYETVFSDVFLRSSSQLLPGAVSTQDFADFDLGELTQRLQSASLGHFGQERAESIQQLALQSVGINFLADAVRVEMRCLIEQIELLETRRCLPDEKLADVMDHTPQHITTIPGVGHVTGAAILAEVGDVQRFETPEKLVAYAGVDAAVCQPGQFGAKEMHMSKRGSPYLRHALWQAAFAASRHDPELQAYYQRKRDEGKDHGVALEAICRKLLHRIYVILKEQRPYTVR